MVNTQIALYDKEGTQLQLADLDAPLSFPSSQSGFFEEVEAEFGAFDPWTVYDPYSDRFFVMAEEVEFGTDGRRGTSGADEAFLLIGVSTSDAPNDLDTAPGDLDNDWHVFSIPAVADFGSGLSWIDYPKISTDADSIYITGNFFRFGDRSFQGTQIIRLDKSDALSGVGTVEARINGPDTTLQPAQSVGRAPGDPQLFVNIDSFRNGIDVHELDDSNTLTLVADDLFGSWAIAGGARQPGTFVTLDSLSDRLMNAVSAVDTTGLTIKNVDPVIVDVMTDATFAGKALPDEVVTLNGSFTDDGIPDTHTAIVEWGDGMTSPATIDQIAGTFTADHAYTTGGIFEVIVTLTDDDGGTTIATTQAVVTGVRLTADGELQVVGTSGKDIVNVMLIGDGAPDRPQIKVIANLDVQGGSDGGADLFLFNPDDVTSIRIVLCKGGDHANVGTGGSDGGPDLAVPTLIEGGAGNDHLTGGAGPDTILGGPGSDKLEGRGGDDLLGRRRGQGRPQGWQRQRLPAWPGG
jgi:hypothetical protein